MIPAAIIVTKLIISAIKKRRAAKAASASSFLYKKYIYLQHVCNLGCELYGTVHSVIHSFHTIFGFLSSRKI